MAVRVIFLSLQFYEVPDTSSVVLRVLAGGKPLWKFDAPVFKNTAFVHGECMIDFKEAITLQVEQGAKKHKFELASGNLHDKQSTLDFIGASKQNYCTLKVKSEKGQVLKPESLQVLVREIDMKKDLDVMGKMDPYIRLIVGQNSYRTKTIEEGGKTSKFMEQFVVERTNQKYLFLQLWDEDLNSSEFGGFGQFEIELALGLKKEFDFHVSLFDQAGTVVGSVHIEVRKVPSRLLKLDLIQAHFKEEVSPAPAFRVRLIKSGQADVIFTTQGKPLQHLYQAISEHFEVTVRNELLLQFQLLSKQKILASSILDLPDFQTEVLFHKLLIEQEGRPPVQLFFSLTGESLGSDAEAATKQKYMKDRRAELLKKDDPEMVKEVPQLKQISVTKTAAQPVAIKKEEQPSAKLSMRVQAGPSKLQSTGLKAVLSGSALNAMFMYEYLEEELKEALTKGIQQLLHKKPADPYQFLGRFLVQFKK